MTNWVGWDIGGAHVKAALVNASGEVVKLVQQPCPLWQGIEHLEQAVSSIAEGFKLTNVRHAVTMTGELVDLFTHRDEGVERIIATLRPILADGRMQVYAGHAGLLALEQIGANQYPAIASANWLASASYAAQCVPKALFIDIGSTTTDILAVVAGHVRAEGYTDYQRLQSQELVYTGIVRTPVMAVVSSVIDEGLAVGVMAEYFATMADVYRVTRELDERHDHYAAADGAEKTVNASARRLARMIGCDFAEKELMRWQRFAEAIKAKQLQKIQASCECILDRYALSNDAPLVAAGIGRFLVKQLALSLRRPYVDFSDLFTQADLVRQAGLQPADCAPAVALACLAQAGAQHG
jgi:probable H4MPT-linked C1 transfer pathway protein